MTNQIEGRDGTAEAVPFQNATMGGLPLIPSQESVAPGTLKVFTQAA
jgi:hypothetical protein